MARQFDQMRVAEPTNYFQHLVERPNVQQEMNSIWDSVPGVQAEAAGV